MNLTSLVLVFMSDLRLGTRFMGHMEAETVILRPTLENL